MPIKSAGGGLITKEFHAYLLNDQTVASSTHYVIPVNTELYDIDGVYDNVTNYRYTPAELGFYHIYGACELRDIDDGKRMIVDVDKNGAIEHQGLKAVCAGANLKLAGVVSSIHRVTNTADYFQLACWHDSGAGVEVRGDSHRTFFGGYRLASR